MSARLTLLTDGSSEGAAVACWIRSRLASACVVEAHGAAHALRIAAAREVESERLVALLPDVPADVDASDLVSLVRTWRHGLSPFELRALGGSVIDEHRSRSPEIEARFDELLHRLAPVRVSRDATRRRGRPTGSDPFRGVGFSVCVALLLERDRQWTDRALADELGHAPSAIHKALSELARRGYLLRSRAGTSLRDELVLRDDLAAAWRGRVGSPRAAHPFRAKSLAHATDVLRRVHAPWLLAGPSAVTGAGSLTGAPVLYTDGAGVDALARSIERAPVATASLLVWPAPEAGVFRSPRDGEWPVTNRVVTYLDLAVSGAPRQVEAARLVWAGEA